MICALLAMFFAAQTSLDTPAKYLFIVPGTNITGKVNLESPILRSEDLSFLHEAYAERWVRQRNAGVLENSATNYYGAVTNYQVFLKADGSEFSGRAKKVSGIWPLEIGITNTLSPPHNPQRIINARYVGGVAPIQNMQRLMIPDVVDDQQDECAITAAVTAVASPMVVYDPCFTNFHSSVYPKLAERQALFTAMGLLDKMVFKAPKVAGPQICTSYFHGEYYTDHWDASPTNWTETVGPTYYTNEFYGIEVQKNYIRHRENREHLVWVDEDDFAKSELKSYDTELTTNAVMSAGAYYLNTSNSADGVSAEILTAAMVTRGDLNIYQTINGKSTNIFEKAYFLVPVSLAFMNDRWLVSDTQWDAWYSNSLQLLGKQEPKDDVSEIPVPTRFEYEGQNHKQWIYRLSCVKIIVGAKFKMRTEISP